MQGEEAEECVRVTNVRKTQSAIAGSKDGRSHEPQNAGGLWKLDRARTQILPYNLHKRTNPAYTLGPVRPISGFRALNL